MNAGSVAILFLASQMTGWAVPVEIFLLMSMLVEFQLKTKPSLKFLINEKGPHSRNTVHLRGEARLFTR